MNQTLYKRVAAGNNSEGVVPLGKTIRKNISYGKYDRDVLDAEKFLMKRLNCGLSGLYKFLVLKEIHNYSSTVTPLLRR